MKHRKTRVAPEPRTSPPLFSKSKTRHLPAVLALCVLTLLAYSNSFSTGFAMDNNWLLLQDKRIQSATSENLKLIFDHTYWWPYGESYLYRPFTTLSYLFNYAILGNSNQSAGYHWINFFLHTGNVLLVYLLGLRLMRRFLPAVLLAALWAIHPVLTESVTNMVGRADLLAAMATLSGFWMYLKSTEAKGTRKWAWLAGLAAVTILGVFSKESAVMIVAVIALYELTWWKDRQQGRAMMFGCLATLPALEWLWYQRSAVMANLPPAEFPFYDNPLVGADFWTARLTAIKIIAKYLGLLLWPAHLSSDYSFAQIPFSTGTAQDWAAWLVIAAVVAGIVLAYRYNRTIFFFGCLAFLTFLPTSNLLFPIGSIMAERFLYLPALGIIACVVIGAFAVAERFGVSRIAVIGLSVVAVLFAVRTWMRNLDWKDDISLGTAAAAVSPNSFKSHAMLANALFESDAAHANLDRVLTESDRATAVLDPLPDSRNEARAYRAGGNYYLVKGDQLRPNEQAAPPPAAVQAYQRSLQLLLRCSAIMKLQRDKERERQHALGETPAIDESAYADLQRLISSVHLKLGDVPKAFDNAVSSLSMAPTNPEGYRQAAHVLVADGNPHEAAVALMEGVLITADQSLRSELLQLYKNGLDPKGCATMSTARGPSLNPACEAVHQDLCAASLKTVRLRLQLQRKDYANDMKTVAVRDFGCPAAPFDDALAH